MLRTTVYLNEEEALAIRRLSAVRKRSQAELIRDAIAKYVESSKTELQHSLPPGIGAYKSGRSDVSQKADELLKKAARKQRDSNS